MLDQIRSVNLFCRNKTHFVPSISFNCSIDHDSTDPTFKNACAFKKCTFCKHLNKSLLKHVLSFKGIPSITKADSVHFGSEVLIQLSLRFSIVKLTTIPNMYNSLWLQLMFGLL